MDLDSLHFSATVCSDLVFLCSKRHKIKLLLGPSGQEEEKRAEEEDMIDYCVRSDKVKRINKFLVASDLMLYNVVFGGGLHRRE